MNRNLRLAIGGAAMAALITGTAALSAWPGYRAIPGDAAMLKLSFSHGGARRCRPLTEQELAKLPPNMRRKETCERQRQPVLVELEIDGALAYAAQLPPTGLSGDGPSRVYEKFVLPAGSHDLVVRLRDSDRTEGFDYRAAHRAELAPGQNFVIDFEAALGGFAFR